MTLWYNTQDCDVTVPPEAMRAREPCSILWSHRMLSEDSLTQRCRASSVSSEQTCVCEDSGQSSMSHAGGAGLKAYPDQGLEVQQDGCSTSALVGARNGTCSMADNGCRLFLTF